MRQRTPTFSPPDTQRTKAEMPDDFGHRTRRCRVCDAWLCRYNAQPICWSHQPEGEGILLEVSPRQWRRFTLAESQRADDLYELMQT